MSPEDLKERLLQFAIRILKLCSALPNTPEGRVIRGQLLRSGTSPGAQYREACRARSAAEFVSKIESAQQELDESEYWMLILERTGIIRPAKLGPLKQEASELMKIFVASARTAKRKK